MRVDLKKYLILGPMSVRDSFFQRMQEEGIVEFIRREPLPIEKPAEIQTFVEAIHILRQMPVVKELPRVDFLSETVLARHVIERQQQLERLREQARIFEKEIARVEVFGDFSLQELHALERDASRVVQFFFHKANKEEPEAVKLPEVIYIASRYGLNYYVALNKERKSYPGLIEIIVERPVGELITRLAEIRREIDEYETELAQIAHLQKSLKHGLIAALNKYHLEDAKRRVSALLEGETFAVEGWVPKNKTARLNQIADEMQLYVSPVRVEPEDKIPTHLENKLPLKIGEDLSRIYDVPSHTDKDPSGWVFFSFITFFSMIVADAGYGILLLGLSLWLLYKFGKKKGFLRRIILLSTYLAIGTTVWGLLMGSFFAIDFEAKHPLRAHSLVNWLVEKKAEYFLREKPKSYQELITEYPNLKNTTTVEGLLMGSVREEEGVGKYPIYNTFQGNVLLELALMVGTIHIMLSLARYTRRNLGNIGWIIFMIGAYLYFPSVVGAVSMIHYVFHVPYEQGAIIGKYLVYGGLSLAVLLLLIQKRLKGLAEVPQVIQIFADVMSYLRIYALSLAGAIMASTFNEIAAKIPIYLGFLVVLVGHLLNITLGLMGGIIHGLRLNFIEWYHYSFEGGGKKFEPLAKIGE